MATVLAPREIAETVHTLNGTKQAFRLIALRSLNPQPNRSTAVLGSEDYLDFQVSVINYRPANSGRCFFEAQGPAEAEELL